MPLPIILGIAAVVAGSTGVGLGINGGVKMKRANDTLKEAQKQDERNRKSLEQTNKSTCKEMDALGKLEIETLAGFKEFSNLFEQIKNKPEFDKIQIGHVDIPSFKGEDLKKASIGASVLVGGLGGAALGTAGGFAASGATTAAVMALGTASTGTAISTLSGVAATNATLAALGGGSLAAGGGGIALGTTILGATTLGVGLLVGGVIFSITGSSISGKADEAWAQMKKNGNKIKKARSFLKELEQAAYSYRRTFEQMRKIYQEQLEKMRSIIKPHKDAKVNWNELSEEDQLIIENMVMIVGLLYNMCKVQLVKKSSRSDSNVVNKEDIYTAQTNAQDAIAQLRYV